MKRVKLEDIAELLNLSKSTVSRALSNDEMISKKTRKRALDAARELNYFPNLIAKSLKKKTTGIFGLMIGDITNPFYIEMVKGVEDTANRYNKSIILTYSDQDPLKELNNLNILYSRQVDGIIITFLIGKHSIDFLKHINIPLVLVDIKPISNFPANYVYTDGEVAGYIGTKHLIENGHKKIALVNGPKIVSSSKQLEAGYLKALKKHYGSFGILHIDAHMDLRTAYEGFTYSHASIMYNVIQELDINQVTQVGIRDFCKEENHFAHEKGIHVFDDSHLKKALFEGETWKSIVNNIIQTLPNLVYISFDIDGLNPELCPNTGTPVPGGLSFEQSMYLIEQLAKSGKRIIGADLVEVTPSEDEWDANVGARVLYHLLGYMHLSNLK